jgi:osmotically-inducible protein OsmY
MFAVALGASGAGCAAMTAPPETATRSAHAPAPPRETQTSHPLDEGAVPDERIVSVLKREYSDPLHCLPQTSGAPAEPVLSTRSVGVDSVLGVVTLRGNVSTGLAKDRALELARVVRGVRAIVDRIDVVPSPRPDYELEFAVAAILSRDPATSGEPIAARASAGVVRLTGEVGSAAERRIAQADVRAVPGVSEVVNDLAIRPHPRDDMRIAEAAVRVLCDDPWLDGSHVRTTAAQGTVRLSGWVSSPQEWTRAAADAATAVPSGAVDATVLRIDRAADDGTLRDRPLAMQSDGDIGQALLDAYVTDTRVHPFVPTVDVHDGVVILTGVAPNPDAARAADEDARNLPGASGVHDDLKVASAVGYEADYAVREEIRAALAREPGLGQQRIFIDVRDGRVYLRGTVANEVDRAKIIAIATNPRGARDVQDGLVLAPLRMGVTNRQK